MRRVEGTAKAQLSTAERLRHDDPRQRLRDRTRDGLIAGPTGDVALALIEQPTRQWIASQRLVDQLVETGSREVGRRVPMPRSVAVWPVRELASQRRSVATVSASHQVSERIATAYRGLDLVSLEDWSAGRADWLIVAGIRLQPGASAIDAELCAVLYDQRIEAPIARFRQRLDASSLNLSPRGLSLDTPLVPQIEVPGRIGIDPDGGPSGPAGDSAVIGTALCDVASTEGDTAVAAALRLPDGAVLRRTLASEQGVVAYEAGRYRSAAQAFGRAVAADERDQQARLGLALALTRAHSEGARRAWNALVDSLLDRGRLSLLAGAPLPPSGRAAGMGQGEPVARQPLVKALRRVDGSVPAALAMWRRAVVTVGTRLRLRGQCLRITPHRDARETLAADFHPAHQRSFELAQWLGAAGSLDRDGLLLGDVADDLPLVGIGTADVRDSWDRRLDLEVIDCAMAGLATLPRVALLPPPLPMATFSPASLPPAFLSPAACSPATFSPATFSPASLSPAVLSITQGQPQKGS